MTFIPRVTCSAEPSDNATMEARMENRPCN
jgi:hypothetical protein